MQKRIAIYIRVSTDKQAKEGESLEAQENALVEYAKKNNYLIVDKYIEYGESGQKLKRTALSRLLEDVKKDKIDMIILTKLDRWFRSVKDFYKVQEIIDEHKVNWKTIWEDYDTTTANGRFQLNVMLSLGELEAQRTAERIRDTFNYKYNIQKTVCSGGKKFGWDIIDKKYVVNKDEAEMRKQALEKLIETQSISETVRWYQKNVRNIGYQSIKKELKDSSVIGIFINEREESIDNFIPPIVSKELFEKAQEVFKSNIKKYPSKVANKHVYIFTGLLECAECHFSLYGTRNGEKYYYRCKHATSMYNHMCNNSKYFSEDRLEKYILENIENAINNKITVIESEQKKVAPKKNRIGAIKSEMNKLSELYITNKINLDFYEKKFDLLKEELYEEEEKNKIKDIDISSLKKFDEKTFLALYSKLDSLGKARFWRDYIERIVIKDYDNIEIKIKVD